MAGRYNRGRRNRGRNNQQQTVSFACSRRFYSLCSHRLGEGIGLVGVYDKLNPDNKNIVQGNIEELCLDEMEKILKNIPDNEEILDTKIRVFVPDLFSYLINGDIADYLYKGCRLNGEQISEELLDKMDNVDTMLRDKSRNVNIRLYQYQPQQMKDESQVWFQQLVDNYLNGLQVNTKTETKPMSLEDQIARALENNDIALAEKIIEMKKQVLALNNSGDNKQEEQETQEQLSIQT